MDTIDTLIYGCYDSAMSKHNMEQLELNVKTLLGVCRKLKDESKRLAVQVESLTSDKKTLLLIKAFTQRNRNIIRKFT